jgi:hypothetical protein
LYTAGLQRDGGPMNVDNATYLDIRHWLDLAAEVEP